MPPKGVKSSVRGGIPLRKMIAGIEFCTRDLDDCTQVVLDAMLQFYGYKLEDVLFDAWRFFYRRGDAGTVQFSLGEFDLGQKFSDYGLSLLCKQAPDAEEAWSAMKQRINEGKPVPAFMDTYYLDYYDPYNRHHAPHYVILNGYDEEQGSVHIVDPAPNRLFRGEMPLHRFKSALSSAYFDNRGENHWLELGFPSKPISPDPNVVRPKIAKNVEAMLIGEKGNHIFWGIEGIRTFVQDLKGWASMEEEALMPAMRACSDFMRSVAFRLEGHSYFLESAGVVLKSVEVKEIASEVYKIAQSWSLLRSMFFKGSKKEPLTMLGRIQHRLLDIADREEQALIALREAIKT